MSNSYRGTQLSGVRESYEKDLYVRYTPQFLLKELKLLKVFNFLLHNLRFFTVNPSIEDTTDYYGMARIERHPTCTLANKESMIQKQIPYSVFNS